MRRMFSEKQLDKRIENHIDTKFEDLALYVDEGTDKLTADRDVALTETLEVYGDTQVGGNLEVLGGISSPSIIEEMEGYSFTKPNTTHRTFENWYTGVVKNGNKITFVLSVDVTQLDGSDLNASFGSFTIPSSIGTKLYPSEVGGYNFLDNKQIQAFSSSNVLKDCPAYISKQNNTSIGFVVWLTNLTQNTKYHIRYEATFLLSDSLTS